MILQDQNEVVALLKDLLQQTKDVSKCVSHILVKLGEENHQKGISFLGVKCQLMIDYLTNLAYVVLLKLTGERLQGNAVVDRLVEIRTVLEKMRPVDRKLKYQIDKLMAATTTGSGSTEDPLHFRADPDSLVQKVETEEARGKYVAPKMAAVHYEGDEEERRRRTYEKARKRALGSAILGDLRREYDPGPQEIVESSRGWLEEADGDRVRDYEEKYLMRTKSNRPQQKKKMGDPSASAVRFNHLSIFDTKPEDFVIPEKKKRRRGQKQQAKKSKKTFKKRRSL